MILLFTSMAGFTANAVFATTFKVLAFEAAIYSSVLLVVGIVLTAKGSSIVRKRASRFTDTLHDSLHFALKGSFRIRGLAEEMNELIPNADAQEIMRICDQMLEKATSNLNQYLESLGEKRIESPPTSTSSK
jgi:hypothetical protein